MPAVTEEAKERAKASAREKYERKKLGYTLDTRGAYRGPPDGSDGLDARCVCGERFGSLDFGMDEFGRLIEPTLCWRCVE